MVFRCVKNISTTIIQSFLYSIVVALCVLYFSTNHQFKLQADSFMKFKKTCHSFTLDSQCQNDGFREGNLRDIVNLVVLIQTLRLLYNVGIFKVRRFISCFGSVFRAHARSRRSSAFEEHVVVNIMSLSYT